MRSRTTLLVSFTSLLLGISVPVAGEVNQTLIAKEFDIAHESLADISATVHFRIRLPGEGPEGAPKPALAPIVDGTQVEYPVAAYPLGEDRRDILQEGTVDYIWVGETARLVFRNHNLLPHLKRTDAADYVEIFSPSESKYFYVAEGLMTLKKCTDEYNYGAYQNLHRYFRLRTNVSHRLHPYSGYKADAVEIHETTEGVYVHIKGGEQAKKEDFRALVQPNYNFICSVYQMAVIESGLLIQIRLTPALAAGGQASHG